MPLIPLDLIDVDTQDSRKQKATRDADAALAASIAAEGLLQPILLRPSGNSGRYSIVAGRRRLRAARHLNHAQIDAHIVHIQPGHDLAAAAAENMVRLPLEPLDQWRAVVELQSHGYTLEAAAGALGLSERHGRRLDRLGRLHENVLAAIEAHGLPSDEDLAAIALAPPSKQAKALTRVIDDMPVWGWENVADLCGNGDRISRALAAFDAEAESVVFDEDLFAEPGSDDQFTTADVAGFLAAQRRALEERVTAANAAGGRMLLAKWNRCDIALPKGWVTVHGSTPDKPPAGATLFVVVSDSGYQVGKIAECRAKPGAAQLGKKGSALPVVGDEADPPKAKKSTTTKPAIKPVDDRPITAAGRDMIAKAKTEALARHLREKGASFDPHTLLAYLALAFGAGNVRVFDAGGYAHIDLASHAATLVPPEGAATLQTADAPAVAAHILADVLIAPGGGSERVEHALEWIGQHAGADAALPRFDTAEFLATCSGTELKRVATEAGLKPVKTVAGLRAQIAGTLPAWRPSGAVFGAPGPKPKPAKKGRKAP